MSRATRRHLIAAGVAIALALVVAVSSLMEAWRVAGAGVALLLMSTVLVLLDLRRRQQVVSQQLRSAADQAAKQSAAVREGIEALHADVQLGSATTATVHEEATAIRESMQAQAESIEVVAKESEAAGMQAVTLSKAIERIPGRLLSEVQALEQLLGRYSPRSPLPIVGGWAVAPTGLLWLVDFVDRLRPGLVVECGSGTSTLWLAQSMRERGSGRVVAIEHDPGFADKTRETLRAHGLSEWAEVRLAPLTDVDTPHGTSRWYDLDPTTLDGIDLLLVDGPPAATGPLARYPALPVLAGRLSAGAHVLIDDARRPDEKEAIERWLEEDHRLSDLGAPGPDLRLLLRS